ncbi:MAG: SDR family NAD(P)-dependent oxidoreductase, partial [Gammaproteobacteria bacterium]|nr:SDR family NAD(P)-dependent oxidoreductase [Gammaproteobacteria bacterium]
PEGAVYQSLENMDYDAWRDMLEINLLAPFKVATAFHDHMAASGLQLHVLMSSGLASIEDNVGGSYAYRSSKAGLNMLASGMGREWDDVITIAMAPGWCRTDLGGADAPVDTADSVRAQQALFAQLSQADSGRYLDFNGATVAY